MSRRTGLFLALALGLGFAVPASAAPALLTRSAAADVPAATQMPVEQANHRWRRGGGSITFHFGPGYAAPRWDGPRYAPPRAYYPRNYQPRAHYPRYHQPRAEYPRYQEPRQRRAAPASAHDRWCATRYQSYRAWDNSFQPYSGRRQQCVSPY